MHIGKARHPKIYVVLWKMKNEDSRGLKKNYKRKNFVPKFQDILHISKHLKRRRNMQFSTRNTLRSAQAHKRGRPELTTGEPGAWFKAPSAWPSRNMRLAHGFKRLAPVTCGSSHYFVTFCRRKSAFLTQN